MPYFLPLGCLPLFQPVQTDTSSSALHEGGVFSTLGVPDHSTDCRGGNIRGHRALQATSAVDAADSHGRYMGVVPADLPMIANIFPLFSGPLLVA